MNMKKTMNTNIEIGHYHPPLGAVMFIGGLVMIFVLLPALSLLGTPMLVTNIGIIVAICMMACLGWVD